MFQRNAKCSFNLNLKFFISQKGQIKLDFEFEFEITHFTEMQIKFESVI